MSHSPAYFVATISSERRSNSIGPPLSLSGGEREGGDFSGREGGGNNRGLTGKKLFRIFKLLAVWCRRRDVLGTEHHYSD